MAEDKGETLKRTQAARGADAKKIYGHPLVKEFFAKIKSHVRGEWERSAAGDKDAREHQWRIFQAVELVEACFVQTIKTGEFAQKELIEHERRKEKERKK